MAFRDSKKMSAWSKTGSKCPGGGGVVAYVSFQGKIMLMPGWMKSAVRSIVVTKADGAVEVISRESTQPGVGANLLGVCDEADEGSDARVVPSPVASSLARALIKKRASVNRRHLHAFALLNPECNTLQNTLRAHSSTRRP